jgi:hypothetical protein
MKGIQFIIDDRGEKTAVVIDLKQWNKEWEAFYNLLLSHSPSDESWLHQSPFLEKLDQALEWNLNHPPQLSNLDVLETQLESNE